MCLFIRNHLYIANNMCFLYLLSVCVHVSAVYRWRCTYVYIHLKATNLGSSYHSPDAVPILFGHRVAHRDLKLSDLDKLVCHWGPVILLLSAPQHWEYGCTLPCLASHLGSGDRIYIVLFSQQVLYHLVHLNRPSDVVLILLCMFYVAKWFIIDFRDEKIHDPGTVHGKAYILVFEWQKV